MLKGYCDFNFNDSQNISQEFDEEEQSVLVDLLSQCNTSSYSNLIKKLCCVIYSNSKEKQEINYSDASDDN